MTDPEIRERFHRAVDATLSGLEGDPLLGQRVFRRAQQKEEPKVRRKLSIGLVIAIALVLMSMTALAAAGLWGVIDFAGLYGARVLDGVAGTLQTNIPQQGGQTSLANFTLREAVCDGQVAYLVFDIVPVDDHTLLVFDLSPTDDVGFLGSEYPEGMTIAEYAESKGYTRVVAVDIHEQQREGYADFTVDSFSEHMTDSGVTLGVEAQGEFSEGMEMAFTCSAIIPAGKADEEAQTAAPVQTVGPDGGVHFEGIVLSYTPPIYSENATLTATLHVDAPLWTASSSEPVDYPEAGIRIDSVKLTGTVMCVYAEVDFTVTDRAVYDGGEGGFWLELIDDAGEQLHTGAYGTGGIWEPDEEGRGRYRKDLQAMDEAPSEVIIRAYSAWTKERCQPVTVALDK